LSAADAGSGGLTAKAEDGGVPRWVRVRVRVRAAYSHTQIQHH
jgi:hypothetical protein